MHHAYLPCLAAAGLCLLPTLAAAQSVYKTPPEPIRRVLDTPPTPSVSLSPTHEYLLLLQRRNLPPIADLAAPMLRLGGLRLNPATNGPHGPRRLSGMTLKKVADGTETRLQLPAEANLSQPIWSADGKYFLFTNPVEGGIELWVGETDKAAVRRLTGPTINAASGAAARWLPDQRSVLVRFVPTTRGPMPEDAKVPTGPVMQDADGKPAPVSTFQDLLQNAHDEQVFDWIMTSQLAVIDVATTQRRDLGKPAVFSDAAPSPSGEYLLVGTVHKPYSYQVPWGRFPERIEVWDLKSGTVVKVVHDAPLRENIPTQGVETGPRGVDWIATRPATLLWAEALDGGDPRAKVPNRDKLMTLPAPFAAEPAELMKLQHRFAGMSWLEEHRGGAG